MHDLPMPFRAAFHSFTPILALFVTSLPAPAHAVASDAPVGSPSAAQSNAPGLETLASLAGMAGKDVLRVKGTFGVFTGVVSRVDANGLSGLRPDPRFPGAAPPAESLAWLQVTSVDRLGTASRRYASIGAAIVGGLAGSLGALIGVGFGTNDRA